MNDASLSIVNSDFMSGNRGRRRRIIGASRERRLSLKLRRDIAAAFGGTETEICVRRTKSPF